MSILRRIGLFFETIVFTVLVPGTVAFWLPRIILDSGRIRLPASWSVAQLAALVPLGLGAAIYLRCVWEFATRGRGIPAPIDHPKELVVTGLYRYVRNPMYLGVLLFLLGEALFLQYRDICCIRWGGSLSFISMCCSTKSQISSVSMDVRMRNIRKP